jgi:hypothetical protein
MTVRVYEITERSDLSVGLDGANRRVGSEVRSFRVAGLPNGFDRAAAVSAALLATVDPANATSVAGPTLAIGQVHPWLDGLESRPLARVRQHSYTGVNATEGILTVVYQTHYVSPSYGGHPAVAGTEITRSETIESVPVFYDLGGGEWRQSAVSVKRSQRYRFERYIVAGSSVDMDSEDLAADKTYLLTTSQGIGLPGFPGGGPGGPTGPGLNWLYLGATLQPNPAVSGQAILTRVFWRTGRMKEISGAGFATVPAVPPLGQLDVETIEASGPVYRVFERETLYEDGGNTANLPQLTGVISP